MLQLVSSLFSHIASRRFAINAIVVLHCLIFALIDCFFRMVTGKMFTHYFSHLPLTALRDVQMYYYFYFSSQCMESR